MTTITKVAGLGIIEARRGQHTIILGRGAGEAKAWSVAKERSRGQRWHSVTHRMADGRLHQVTCYDGQETSHVYDADYWWTGSMTVAQKVAKMDAARRQSAEAAR